MEDQYASWRRQLAAGLLDRGLSYLVYQALFFLAGALIELVRQLTNRSAHQADFALGVLTPFLVMVGFGLWVTVLVANRVVMQGRTGQSLGKKALGIALADAETGRPIGSLRALARWCLHLLDWMSLGAGFLAPLWGGRRQTFADLAGTSVVVRIAPRTTDRPRLSSRFSNWLTSRQVPVEGRIGPRLSVLLVAVLYALGFGYPIYVAIRYLVNTHSGSHQHPHGWTTSNVIETSLVALATVLAAVLLIRQAPRWSRPTGAGAKWITTVKTFGLAWIAMAAGSAAGALLGMHAPAGRTDPAMVWPEMVTSALAGPGEEIVVLAMPLVFLRAGKWRWSAVFTVALVLRLAYHVYYGYPVVGFVVWALAVMVIYLRTHAILGLILAHSYWDLTISVGDYWSHAVRAAMFTAVVLGLILWATGTLIWKLIVGIDSGPDPRVAALAT